MAFDVDADSIYQVQIRGLLHGQVTINTFNYTNPEAFTGWTSVNDLEFITSFRDNVLNDFMPCTHAEWSLQPVRAQWIFPTRFRFHEEEVTPTGSQVATGDCLPSQNAVVIRRRTELASRSSRGRIFVPAVPTEFEADSALNPAALTIYGDLAQAMLSTLTNATNEELHPVIWSPQDPFNRDRVTSSFVDPVIRAQRRRQLRRGI